MKIEITVEGQEPVVHKLVKEKTVLGTGPDCDVVIDSESLSRRHIIVVAEDDQYFVLDQGSANGSFINEERLVPGQRASFTSFFPVKLGFNVTVSLLSDEEVKKFEFAQNLTPPSEAKPRNEAPSSPPLANSTSARSPVRSPVNKTTRFSSVKKTTSSPVAKKRQDEPLSFLKVIGFVIAIGGSVAFFYFRKGPGQADLTSAGVNKTQAPDPTPADFKFIPLLPNDIESGLNRYSDPACTPAEIASLCQGLQLPREGYRLTGVVGGLTSVTLVLPYFVGEEISEGFKSSFAWKSKTASEMNALSDERDLIALHLLAHYDVQWSNLSQEMRWVYVVLVDKNGRRKGANWMASLVGLRTFMQNKEQIFSMRGIVLGSGAQGLAPLAGMFRPIP